MPTNNAQLISSIAAFTEKKNIDKHTVILMLKEVLENLIVKKFGPDHHIDVIIDNDQAARLDFTAQRTGGVGCK